MRTQFAGKSVEDWRRIIDVNPSTQSIPVRGVTLSRSTNGLVWAGVSELIIATVVIGSGNYLSARSP